jgi:hypothetical protein
VKELKDKIIQHSLFDSPSEYTASSIQPLSLSMSKEALLQWKDKIANYQNKAATRKLSGQSSLFDLATHDNEFASINPLELPLQPIEFYRLPVSDRHSIATLVNLSAVRHCDLVDGTRQTGLGLDEIFLELTK